MSGTSTPVSPCSVLVSAMPSCLLAPKGGAAGFLAEEAGGWGTLKIAGVRTSQKSPSAD